LALSAKEDEGWMSDKTPSAAMNSFLTIGEKVLDKRLLMRTVHGSKGPQDDAYTRWLAKIDIRRDGRPLA
jgi:hypothetical protein